MKVAQMRQLVRAAPKDDRVQLEEHGKRMRRGSEEPWAKAQVEKDAQLARCRAGRAFEQVAGHRPGADTSIMEKNKRTGRKVAGNPPNPKSTPG